MAIKLIDGFIVGCCELAQFKLSLLIWLRLFAMWQPTVVRIRGDAGEGLAEESALETPKLLWASHELIEGETGDRAIRSGAEVWAPLVVVEWPSELGTIKLSWPAN